MRFKGHELYQLSKNWYFDKTEFIGYFTIRDVDDKILECVKAFKIIDEDVNKDFVCVKYIQNVPVGVIRKSEELIKQYYREAFICEPESV